VARKWFPNNVIAVSPLRITHVQGIFAPEHGGPTQSLTNYCQGQVERGQQVSLRVLEGYPHVSPARRLAPPIDEVVCPVDWPASLGSSRALRQVLRRDPTPDIYHLHGVWLRAMHYGAVEARKRGVPYLVELMGAYERHPLRQKWLKKWIARHWYQDALLRRAACLHVNSAKEAQELRALGFRLPIAVIPVGVDTRAIAAAASAEPRTSPWPELDGRPFLLFLARIHPKKGIDLLLEAWANLDPSLGDWTLVVAGDGEPAYVGACQALLKERGLGRRVLWVGAVSEQEKSWLYRNAGCYVLPSYSENFGNTVAEALAHETPVITTRHTVWTNLPAEGCGWLAETDEGSLRAVLERALELEPDERKAMGRIGRRLVQNSFSLDAVIEQLAQVYAWTLGASRPGNVTV
jgi:glycosyltransferase involved in cell wall biosynthesis